MHFREQYVSGHIYFYIRPHLKIVSERDMPTRGTIFFFHNASMGWLFTFD